MSRKAFITGITDRTDPSHRLKRFEHIQDSLHLHAGSLESFPSTYHVMRSVLPEECYHLVSQSFLNYSFDDEFSTLQTDINGTHHILVSMKDVVSQWRLYLAGSSEMFGKVAEVPQTENTRVFTPARHI